MLNLPKERIKEDKEIKVIMIRQLNPSLWCWGDTRYHPYKKKLFSIPCYHRRYYQAKYRGGGGGGGLREKLRLEWWEIKRVTGD